VLYYASGNEHTIAFFVVPDDLRFSRGPKDAWRFLASPAAGSSDTFSTREVSAVTKGAHRAIVSSAASSHGPFG
jgi:hypothetical protein